MFRNKYLPLLKTVFIACFLALSIQLSKAQAVLLPYSYQLDQKFDSSIYSLNTSFHTALKPFIIDSVIAPEYDAIMNRGVDSNRKTWVGRKIFNEHLFDVKKKEFTFYGDYLTDIQAGRDFNNKINTYMNTRGYQFGGTVGKNFFFYTSGFENAAKFPSFYNKIVNQYGFIPGQSYDRNYLGITPGTNDWSYVTSIISYSPIKQLNIVLGEDKTFIGDGYRSILLSDFAANYPLLRLTANLGKFQYMIMWAYMEDRTSAVKFDSFGNNRRKWGAFHYLDWNVSKRVSLGFFNALIASEADNSGHLHGFDANYINPLFYSNALNPTPSQPDNVLVGFNGKYKIFDKTAIYGQLLLDEFKAGNFLSKSTTENTNGVQLGIRGADLFKVTNFNYLFEFNTVKPYTYASAQPITSYTDYNESLADPLGANFREFIGILNYSYGRFDFMGQLNYARFGLDPNNSSNFGMNVNKPFVNNGSPTSVGQGLRTNLYYAAGTVSLLINPKTNLRFELGGVVRDESNSSGSQKTVWLTFGLRSSFRQIYQDF